RDDGPLLSRGGYGDRVTALNLLAAILAAMRIKDKTGEGQYVEVTLQRTGVWAMASDVTTALYDRVDADKTSQKAPGNPIWNYYRTADDRWFAMVMPFALHYWPKFCAMLDRDDWASDERFQTTLGLMEHGPSIIPELNDLFASQNLQYWREQLDNAGLIWEPISLVTEVIEDPALRERGAFSVIAHERVGAIEVVSAPFEIRNADVEVRGPAPDVGQHTREVFEEFGVDVGKVESMIERGVLQ
ncbi:MAG: CoA transferase, partial [bacterium]